jgi:site-specific recombinase XerD
MHDETAITIYADVTQAITSPSAADTRPVWSVDIAIKQWLDAKHKHTQSLRTYETYENTLQEFRAALQSQGLDLDSVQAQDDKRSMQIMRDQVKQIAQLFAGFSKRNCQVKPSTMNHRYAVLSSFYSFCIKQEWLDYNPIEHLERSKVESYTDRKALDFDDVAAMFDRFDMNKPEDMRDCALLAIALQTGHRVTALAGLRWKHVSVRRGIATLYFERCKGNKNATVELDGKASKALMRWLHKHYGQQLGRLPGESPLWVSLARGCDPRTMQPSYGQALSIQAIGQICQKWTGTAHVHRLRNTFVMGMLESGASLREIQGKLLHSSMATTSGYVDKLTEAKNAHAGDLSKLFNIK